MGYSPQQVNEMSLWQWFAAFHGFVDANSPKDGNKLTESEADELFDWIEQDRGEARELSTQTYWWDGDVPVPVGAVSFTA